MHCSSTCNALGCDWLNGIASYQYSSNSQGGCFPNCCLRNNWKLDSVSGYSNDGLSGFGNGYQIDNADCEYTAGNYPNGITGYPYPSSALGMFTNEVKLNAGVYTYKFETKSGFYASEYGYCYIELAVYGVDNGLILYDYEFDEFDFTDDDGHPINGDIYTLVVNTTMLNSTYIANAQVFAPTWSTSPAAIQLFGSPPQNPSINVGVAFGCYNYSSTPDPVASANPVVVELC